MSRAQARPGATGKARGFRFRIAVLSLAVACCFAGSAAQGQPFGPQVVSGQASFATQGNSLIVNNSPNAIINWQGFSIGANELTRFNQQSAASAVLNRVIGLDNSAILGALQSNGKVYLINPNGIFIGPNARIDVAGLIASTLDLTNQDFLAGRYQFNAGPMAGKLTNQGRITTPEGGQIYLLAPNIENSGILTSPKGDVTLAAGHSVQLVDSANPHLQVVVSAPADQALNLGEIVAQAGRIGIYGALVSHKGKLSADSAVVGENGKIILKASRDTLVEGSLSAQGAGQGGEIQVLGERVGILDGARLDASGQSGGGTILVGGDYQGKNPAIQNAQRSYVGAQAEIHADAQQGDGGKIIVWSDEATRVHGLLSARGGANGKGGFIETSGHYLDVAGIKVNAGKGGTWLLDPYDIEIVASGGSTTLSNFDQFADAPASGVSLLDSATVANYTPSGTSGSSVVALQASHDITLSAPVVITTSGIGVNMKAGNDININAALSSNNGAITLSANDAGGPASGSGMLKVSPSGSIASNGGTISISAIDIDLQGPLNAAAGNVSISAIGNNSIALGSASGTLSLSGAELQQISAAKLILNTSSQGNVTSNNVSSANSQGFANLEINAGRALFTGQPSVFQSVTANLVNSFEIYDGGALTTLNGDVVVTASDVSLDGALNVGTADVRITGTSGKAIGIGDAERDLNFPHTALQNVSAKDLYLSANGANLEAGGVVLADTAGIAGKVVLAGQSVAFSGSSSTFRTLTVNAEQGVFLHTDLTTTVGDLRINGNSNNLTGTDPYTQIAVDGGLTLSAAGKLVFSNDVNVGPHASFNLPQGDANFSATQGIDFFGAYTHHGSGYATVLTAGTGQSPATISATSINAGDNTLTVHGNLQALDSELNLYGRTPQFDGTLTASTLKVVNKRADCTSGNACDIGLGESFTDRSGITWIDPGKVSADSVWLEAKGGSIEVRSVNKPAWNLDLRAAPYEVVEAAEPPRHNVYGGMIAFTSGATTVGSLTALAGNGINIEHALTASSGELNLDAHYDFSVPSDDVSVGYNPVITIAGGTSTPTTLTAAGDITLDAGAVNVENGSATFISQTGNIATNAAIAASATGARVTFEATAGTLHFNGSPGTKISADEAVIKTRYGFVAPDDKLLTSVSRLQVEFNGNEDVGDMTIVNNKAGGLELANLDGSAGGYAIYQTGGKVDIRTATTSQDGKTYGQNLTVTGKVVATAGAGNIQLAVTGTEYDLVPTTLDVQNVIKHEGVGSITLTDVGTYYNGTPLYPAYLTVGTVNGQHTVETTQGNVYLKFADAALSGTIKAGATGSDIYAANEGVVFVQPRIGYDDQNVWTLSNASGWVQGFDKFYANRLSFYAGQQPLTLSALDLGVVAHVGYVEFKTVECGECVVPDLNVNGPLISPVSVGFVAGESLNLNAASSITSAGSVNLITDVLNVHATAGNVTAATGNIVVAPYTNSKGVAVSLTDPGGSYPGGGECGPHGCGGATSDLWLNSSRLNLFNAPYGNLQIGWQNSDGSIATVGDIVFYEPAVLTTVQGLVLRTQNDVMAMIPPLYSQNPPPEQKIISAPQGIDIRSGGLYSDATFSSANIVLQTNNIQLGDDGRFVASNGVSLAPYNYTERNSFIEIGTDCSRMVCSSSQGEGDYQGIVVNPTWLSRVVTPNLDLGHQTCTNGVCAVDFAGDIYIGAPLTGSEASFKNLGLLTLGGIYQDEDSAITLPVCTGCGGLAAEAHDGGIDLSYSANSVSYFAAKSTDSGNGIYFWNDKTLTIANANNIHGVTSNGGEINIWVENGDLIVGGAVPGISPSVYYSGINACPTSGTCGNVYLDVGGALRGLLGVTQSVVGSKFEADTRHGICAGLDGTECGTTALPFATQVAQLDLENKVQDWDTGEGGGALYTIKGSIKVVNNSLTHSAELEIIRAENFAAQADGGGNVVIDNFGKTTVGYQTLNENEQLVDAAGTVSAASGNVTIAAHSPLVVNGGSTVSASSNVSLSAGQGSGGNDNLVLNGNVTSTSGNISLAAYSGITVGSTATLEVTTGTGGVTATATTGAIAINAPASSISVASGSSAIVLSAGGAITGAPPGAVSTPNGTGTTNAGTTPTTTPVLPTLVQCTTNPSLSGCTSVLPTLAQCTLNPAAAGCTAVLPTIGQCTVNPATAGCAAVLPSTTQCSANPALPGCSAVLPSVSQCAANPGLAGCSTVLPSTDQCVTNPNLAGCTAVLPTVAQCTVNPALSGCVSVLPSLTQCLANTALPGCSVILPSLAQCTVNPNLSGCSTVLPSTSQCAANPSLAGCTSVLPSLAVCTANPGLSGCASVLPSLLQCTANPALAGCTAVLPTTNQCAANPTLSGCAAVLPTLAQCTANPGLSGCASILPTLVQCSVNPALSGCAAVMPTLSQCVRDPSLSGCASVLPTLAQCAATPVLSGCSSVLPSVAQCTANASLAGCSAVLPSVSQCASNPGQAGCTVVLPTLV